MCKKYAILIVIALTIGAITYGQDTTTNISLQLAPKDTAYNKYHLPSISVGAGIMSFFGDIVSYNSKIRQVGRFNSVATFVIEQRFGSAFGVSLSGLKGSLCENDNRMNRHFNFQTDVLQANLSINFHFDNGFIINKTSRFAPYMTAGFGFMTFNDRGDLRDKNNKFYYYWPDGTIRDKNFDWENPQNGNILNRDYKFETKLDSLNLYHHYAFTLPIGGGLNFKLSDKFEAYISSVYFFTNSDVIDNLSNNTHPKYHFFNTHNDGYLFTSVTLQYNLSGLSKDKLDNRPYKDINFEALNEMDSDGDGVKDSEDKCPDTPAGVKVDSEGCPLDGDKDGVPDYLDKELNTLAVAIVDENGVTLTQQMMEVDYLKDSLKMIGAMDHDRDSTMTTSFEGKDMMRQQLQVYYNKLNDNQIVNDGRFPIVVEPSDKNHAITNADNTSIVFKVQLGTFKNKIPVDIINKLIDALAGAGFEHIVNKENGYTDYMSGNFNNYNSAEEYKDKLVEKGIKDAFVVAFQNNHKITVPKALELLKNK